jgi:hypothetical protein
MFPRGLVFLGNHGVDEGVSQGAARIQLVVAEFAFETEAGALDDPRAREVAGVAPELRAPGA